MKSIQEHILIIDTRLTPRLSKGRDYWIILLVAGRSFLFSLTAMLYSPWFVTSITILLVIRSSLHSHHHVSNRRRKDETQENVPHQHVIYITHKALNMAAPRIWGWTWPPGDTSRTSHQQLILSWILSALVHPLYKLPCTFFMISIKIYLDIIVYWDETKFDIFRFSAYWLDACSQMFTYVQGPTEAQTMVPLIRFG